MHKSWRYETQLFMNALRHTSTFAALQAVDEDQAAASKAV
jgi:hypothetical protein